MPKAGRVSEIENAVRPVLRTRRRLGRLLGAKQSEINDLREERDRANALLLAEPQVIVVWPAGADEPDIVGDPAIVTRTALPRRVLAFGTWLEPDKAQAMEEAVEALRGEGRSFAFNLTTLQDRHVAAEGRAIGGRAVLRIKDLTGPKNELVELAADHQQLRRDIDTVGRLLEALPSPVWARDTAGQLMCQQPPPFLRLRRELPRIEHHILTQRIGPGVHLPRRGGRSYVGMHAHA